MAEEGCTDCGRKGGCDHRKAGMFSAIDEALARLYPTRRWGERDEGEAFRAGVRPDVAATLAERLAGRLGALTLVRQGGPDEFCDFVYVLCFGREPSILEVREGIVAPDAAWDESVGDEPVDELYLRVALSAVAPFAAVQQVAMRMRRVDGHELVIEEVPRTGVFDPILLPRLQKLVAVLAELDVRHLDFGDLTVPPSGYDAGDYRDRYGAEPTIANYLFYPQPASSITTRFVPLARRTLDSP